MTTNSSDGAARSNSKGPDGLSLRARIRGGLGAIAVALALLSAAAFVSLTRLGGAIETILRENYASVILCESMKEALERQDSAALFAAVGHEDIALPMLLANRREFERALEREQANITVRGERELVDQINAEYAAYTREVDRVLALAPRENEERSRAYFRDLLPRFSALKGLVQDVLRLNQESMEQADQAAKRLAKQNLELALAVCVAIVGLAAWLAWWMPRALVRPLDALTRAARSIGDGNLSVLIDEPKVTEFAALADAFRKMQERLRAYRESSLGELLAAKDLARSTLSCLLDPVVVFDAEGGVLFGNEAAEEAFGIVSGTAEELRKADVKIPKEASFARDLVFATGEPVLPKSLSEAMEWRGDGGVKHYLVRALPLKAADTSSVVVVLLDVTRFHRIDELKSDMVATVSHEFKTPLTSLRMATHLLLETSTGPLNEAQKELVETAKNDTERLRNMVEELLDVVRIESEAGALRRVPIEPSGLLMQVIDAHRAVAKEKGVALEIEGAGDAGLVMVDPDRLSIALANLVANAIRHTPPGGRVALCAEREGGAVKLRVSDNGEGIDPVDLPKIFERATQAAVREGDPPRHGLGLTIAREIARQHGGDLTVKSELGQGSVFTLGIPSTSARPASVEGEV